MPDNPGLAVAFNTALADCATDWMLLLDQDSEVLKDGLANLIGHARRASANIGVVTGVIVEQGTGGSTNRTGSRQGAALAVLPVPLFQNSGTLVRVAAAREIGGWWTKLHLDLVDAEFGVRLNRSSWVQLQTDATVLRHRLGETTAFRLGPLTAHATHHSVARRKELGQALGLTIRRHGILGRDVRSIIRNVAGNMGGVVLAERQRSAKLFGFIVSFAIALLGRGGFPAGEALSTTTLQRTGRIDG